MKEQTLNVWWRVKERPTTTTTIRSDRIGGFRWENHRVGGGYDRRTQRRWWEARVTLIKASLYARNLQVSLPRPHIRQLSLRVGSGGWRGGTQKYMRRVLLPPPHPIPFSFIASPFRAVTAAATADVPIINMQWQSEPPVFTLLCISRVALLSRPGRVCVDYQASCSWNKKKKLRLSNPIGASRQENREPKGGSASLHFFFFY